MLETMGDFDPTFFDLQEVNEILADIEEGDWFEDEEDDDDDFDEDDDYDDHLFDDFNDDVKKN